MDIFKKISSSLSENRLPLIVFQLILSGIALGTLSWNTVTFAKNLLLKNVEFNVNPWINIFFHPYESGLINYIFLCIGVGLYGLFIYIVWNTKKIEAIAEKANLFKCILLLITSVVILTTLLILPLSLRIPTASFVSLIPLVYFINFRNKTVNRILLVFTWLLLLIVSVEPLKCVIGPTYLMNEYDSIYSDTKMKGGYVNNKAFLDNLKDIDIETVKAFYLLKNRYEGKKIKNTVSMDNLDFLKEFRSQNLEPVQNFLISTVASSGLSETMIQENEKDMNVKYIQYICNKNYLNNLKNINVESIKDFYLKNNLEYYHQNNSRGQINHIGHILNPINEYECGKPLKDIYMQYGLGNTFLMKWIMDLFGGISIENYYRCFIFYIIYFLSFLFMLQFLFKDNLYVFGVFAFLTAAFFYQGFTAFVLAPGIIPSIHFFDVIVLMLLLLFFRYDRLIYFMLATLFVILGIIVNQQFGMMLAAPLFVSLFLYIIENKQRGKKYFWLLNLFLILLLSLFVYRLVYSVTSGQTFLYFFMGYFSWKPNFIVISFTIFYLIMSYFFLVLLKDKRFYLKYIYLFVFIYTQCLFVYYYWSGLSNHLPTVIPFAMLQLFLMIFISEKALSNDHVFIKKLLDSAKIVLAIFAVLSLLITAKQFYKKENILFKENFVDHKTYNWKFDRANIITTINPEPVRESISLIQQYSKPNDRGIYILSKYDNLLPYLAKKYSLMPYFEMSWYLLSDKERYITVNKIKKDKPEYIFVDTNINQNISDPWAKIYTDDFSKLERTSRIGRYSELKKIFNEIAYDYEPIEKGYLITVYKRKN